MRARVQELGVGARYAIAPRPGIKIERTPWLVTPHDADELIARGPRERGCSPTPGFMAIIPHGLDRAGVVLTASEFAFEKSIDEELIQLIARGDVMTTLLSREHSHRIQVDAWLGRRRDERWALAAKIAP